MLQGAALSGTLIIRHSTSSVQQMLLTIQCQEREWPAQSPIQKRKLAQCLLPLAHPQLLQMPLLLLPAARRATGRRQCTAQPVQAPEDPGSSSPHPLGGSQQLGPGWTPTDKAVMMSPGTRVRAGFWLPLHQTAGRQLAHRPAGRQVALAVAYMGQLALQQLLESQGSLQMLRQEHWVQLPVTAGCRLQAAPATVLPLAHVSSSSQQRLQRQQGGRLPLLLRQGRLLLLLRLGRPAPEGEGNPAAAPGWPTHMLLPAGFLVPPDSQARGRQCSTEVHRQGLLRMQVWKAVLLGPGEQVTALQVACRARMAVWVMQLPPPRLQVPPLRRPTI